MASVINLLVFGIGSILLLASKQRKYLDKASIWCIVVYLSSIIIYCAYSIYDAIKLDNEDESGMRIHTMTAEFLSIGVFLYFMYDLYLVKIRLECISQETFTKKHRTLTRFFKYLIFPSVILTWLMKVSLNIKEPN